MKTLKEQGIWFLLANLFLVLAACASLAKPETFDQRLAYAYSTLASVRQVTADLVIAKRISPDDGRKVQQEADATRVILDASRTAYVGKDLSTAEAKLSAAQQLLTALQLWLRAKEGGN